MSSQEESEQEKVFQDVKEYLVGTENDAQAKDLIESLMRIIEGAKGHKRPKLNERSSLDSAAKTSLASSAAPTGGKVGPGDYTTGWVCASPMECEAACLFLDEPSIRYYDDDKFTLGRIGQHNVAIACTHSMGKYSDFQIAIRMKNTFPNIRTCLIFGIAGGAPSPKHDIRLGDIVVGAPHNGKAALVQFDLGSRSSSSSSTAVVRGFLNQPPRFLRTAINYLQAQYELDGHRLDESISMALEHRSSRLRKKFSQPDEQTDKLYRSKATTQVDMPGVLAAESGDEIPDPVSRGKRTEYEDNPKIHYGSLASSSNMFIKASEVRDRVAAELDVLSFGINSPGITDIVPCLMIRGISDYSDSHKTKDWQPYAAITAAAYVNDLLSVIPLNESEFKRSRQKGAHVTDPDDLAQPRRVRKSPEDYTVGWLCAIKPEFVSALCFLDEIHERPGYVARHDNNIYTLGRIGTLNVVIAALPYGEYGTVSAANLAGDMLHSFPNIEFGLMVGVGGGAPSSDNDIRLGDIVVSCAADFHGGVFQYDFGKTIQGQAFYPTGLLDKPPEDLRFAVDQLKYLHEREAPPQIHPAIEEVLQKRPRLKQKYGRPPAESDRLFKSTFAHPKDSEEDCSVVCCGGSPPHPLAERSNRGEQGTNPVIHYGLIASANQVMKGAEVRDKLAAEKNVLCFEMEAAGLMNHFPCLVIRGICDYSDSHKNKAWQGYAAMAAAAYAKELIGVLGEIVSRRGVSSPPWFF